jgi:hypothetical protein
VANTAATSNAQTTTPIFVRRFCPPKIMISCDCCVLIPSDASLWYLLLYSEMRLRSNSHRNLVQIRGVCQVKHVQSLNKPVRSIDFLPEPDRFRAMLFKPGSASRGLFMTAHTIPFAVQAQDPLMPARIIHVGPDVCHRLSVLQSAGYSVKECNSVDELRQSLESDAQPDAVVVTQDHGQLFRKAASLVHGYSDIPLILFGERQGTCTDSSIDLVVPVLASPERWLKEIAVLVAHFQALRLRSRMALIRTPSPEAEPGDHGAKNGS